MAGAGLAGAGLAGTGFVEVGIEAVDERTEVADGSAVVGTVLAAGLVAGTVVFAATLGGSDAVASGGTVVVRLAVVENAGKSVAGGALAELSVG